MCRVRSLGGTRTTITSSPSSLVDENEDKQSFSASLLPTAAETGSIIRLHKEVVSNQISGRWRGVRYIFKNIVTGKKSFAWMENYDPSSGRTPSSFPHKQLCSLADWPCIV